MKKPDIPYKTLASAYYFVGDMIIGNSDVGSFELGGSPSQATILYTLHSLTAFIIMIHLLNMLVAIMGNTFAERSSIIDKIFYRDHLNFVLDNWYLIQTVLGKQLKDIKYIIGALSVQDEDMNNEMFTELKDKIDD